MEIYTVYQPIIELLSGKTIGHEALLRGPEPPDKLINQAIKENRLYELERSSIQSAFKFYDNHKKRLFINCHPYTFTNIYTLLMKSLSRYPHILPENIIIELTEQQRHLVDIRETLKLKTLGIQIALDDFTNLTSDYLLITTLRPSIIKLDRSIIVDIVNSSEDRKQVKEIMDYAKKLNVELIVEGIESKKQLEVLRKCGIKYGQGYLLGEPERFDQNLIYRTL